MDQQPVTCADLTISSLGPCGHSSPAMLRDLATEAGGWVDDGQKILLHDDLATVTAAARDNLPMPAIELAGPRRKIFFAPDLTTCAIVTCGGLCPGLNDVIRAIVMQAHTGYGVRRVLGLRYGYEGLSPAHAHEPLVLTPDNVNTIHYFGGSILGSSRGEQDVAVMADQLMKLGVDVLFVVGGDGSQQGAREIFEETRRRGCPIAVIGVPKTIDNDLPYMDRSFGYLTAFTAACQIVTAAECEARGARNGVGLVKLMGRDSGFIACSAALATSEADFVLIPEVPFRLDGSDGLLAELERRLASNGHALIIAAEGAGQDLMAAADTGADASNNKRKADIGLFLQTAINRHFHDSGREVNLKYIDPSYIIRSVPAAPEDRIFCLQLGTAAVHAAMAGKTGMVVARWHQRYVHLPMKLVTRGRCKVDPQGTLWRSVLETTGQPAILGD